MDTSTQRSAEVRESVTGPTALRFESVTRLEVGTGAAPPDFVPLHLETRSHVSTRVMCRHVNRKEQTGRAWACLETFPDGLRPIRVNGRLAWPVAGIRRVLGVAP